MAMTAVYLRVGVFVVVASVVSGISRSQPQNLRSVVRRSPFASPQSADTVPSSSQANTIDVSKGVPPQAKNNVLVPTFSLPVPTPSPFETRQSRVADLK